MSVDEKQRPTAGAPGERRDDLAPALGPREMLRWTWRQLTSMRTALFLLMLLAITAVPGSIWPQRGTDARAVERYLLEHPDLGPWLDRLGFFSVFTSPWFSAVYLLLMVSLVGCIVPRSLVYARALRARPPKAPRNLQRFPASDRFETDADPVEVLAAARSAIGRARIDVVTEDGSEGGELRAESGQLRELGNLVFHVSVVVVLIGVAVGALFSYRATSIIVQGDSFSNTPTEFDELAAGAFFNIERLPRFSLDLDTMIARFRTDGEQRGAPRLFRAQGTYQEGDGQQKPFDIEVNHPLHIGSTGVFLVGQGYAPVLKVTDAQGDVVFDQAVPFLPNDATYTSTGVVKVTDARPQQLGFQGFFLPTAVSNGDEQASISAFPGAANPLLGLFMYEGNLGLDDGLPQSVYVLDKTRLKQVDQANGKPYRVSLSPGQTQDLPGGGSIEFTDLKLFGRFQVASTPLLGVPLWGTVAGVAGLLLSLFVRPRRTWVRARRVGSRTVVEIAALDRVPRDDLPDELREVVDRIRQALPPGTEESTA